MEASIESIETFEMSSIDCVTNADRVIFVSVNKDREEMNSVKCLAPSQRKKVILKRRRCMENKQHLIF